jgi:hypothetical protein
MQNVFELRYSHNRHSDVEGAMKTVEDLMTHLSGRAHRSIGLSVHGLACQSKRPSSTVQ